MAGFFLSAPGMTCAGGRPLPGDQAFSLGRAEAPVRRLTRGADLAFFLETPEGLPAALALALAAALRLLVALACVFATALLLPTVVTSFFYSLTLAGGSALGFGRRQTGGGRI